MNRTPHPLVAFALAALALPALAAEDPMLTLATRSGCTACHQVEPGARGPDGLPPVGPAWREVAERYRGDTTAQDKLMLTVMTGSNRNASHWKGKVSGPAMPPNELALRESDARQLVRWILALKPAA